MARSGRERERELTLEREVAGGPSEGEGLRVVSRLGDEGVVVVGGVEAVLVVALHRVLGARDRARWGRVVDEVMRTRRVTAGWKAVRVGPGGRGWVCGAAERARCCAERGER